VRLADVLPLGCGGRFAGGLDDRGCLELGQSPLNLGVHGQFDAHPHRDLAHRVQHAITER
jgi:hypothetical protein